ncbi:hypothetical protein [uncultured Nostoc sp.]
MAFLDQIQMVRQYFNGAIAKLNDEKGKKAQEHSHIILNYELFKIGNIPF